LPVFVAIFVSLIILGLEFWQLTEFWIIAFLLIIMAWYRAKERGFYYAKEVLNIALNKLEKE
jgi:hypothetical protein